MGVNGIYNLIINNDFNSTKPIIDKFKAAGKVRTVDSHRSLDDVFGDVRLHFQSASSRN